MNIGTLLLLLAGFLAAGWLIWWLIFETEGVYLGRGVVVGLYDLYARRYDRIKGTDELDEHLLLAQPLLRRLHPATDPLILDVATGTGRMPLALCQHARFEGHIIALDASRKMLRVAAEKLAEQYFDEYVTLVWGDGARLPCADAAFDVVTCMEALEFMPQPAAALAELCSVLRPGGVLLTTRRINARWFIGRLWDEATMRQLLAQAGMAAVEFQVWQRDYQLVWGIKAGESAFIGARPADEVLHPAALAHIMAFPSPA